MDITVGGPGAYDPAPNQTDCLLPHKKGMDLVVKQRGIGEKKPSEIQILSAGGFRLLGGDVFVLGDIWFIYDAGAVYASGANSYSNGFNYNQVISALFGRIGWRNSTIAGAPGMNGANATSRSGRYFNDFHAIASPHIVSKVLEDNEATNDQVNAYLESLQKGAIMRSLNGVLNEPEFLEVTLDFDRYREQNDRVVNPSGLFVGRRITPGKLMDRAVQIDSVGLLFDGDITFPMYLFQEGKQAPIWTGEVTAIANETTVVALPDLILSYLGTNHLGGAYYFGYFQEDLGGVKAIDQSRICVNVANNWEMEFIESKQTAPGTPAFSRTIVNGSPWSHGMNVQLSAFKDWTQQIVRKQNLFDELIGLTVAATLIELALHNVRSNPEERILKDQLISLGLYQQLDGVSPGIPDAPKVVGLRNQITREVERVKKSFYPNHRAINYRLNDCS